MAYYQDHHITVYNKDCRNMSELADNSIQMVCTSPPYWGLRKYAGLPDLIWGGDSSCGHNEMIPDSVKHDNLRFRGENSIVGNERNKEIHPVHSWSESTFAIQGNNSMVRGKDETDSGNFAIPKFKDTDMKQRKEVVGSFCSLCGAWKGAYGLEPTPEMYVQHTMEILREIRRVLRKDGVVFLNIGDTYLGSNCGYGDYRGNKSSISIPIIYGSIKKPQAKVGKPKDLCLIPFRVAIAAQEDGWWVRSVIIWNKPNPMPESVTDRPTESHEYILMLTKSAKYYWDAEAVREPLQPSTVSRYQYDSGYNPKTLLIQAEQGRTFTGFPQYRGYKTKHNTESLEGEQYHGQDISAEPGRNLRSVWTFPTQPYPEAHFATYPEKLVEICVKAATPEVGCCSKCGKPWVRIVEIIPRDESKIKYKDWSEFSPIETHQQTGNPIQATNPPAPQTKTLGWKAQCKCEAEKVPSIVLDPFAGSGTTLWVAKKLNRKAVGYELSREYCELTIDRNKQQALALEP